MKKILTVLSLTIILCSCANKKPTEYKDAVSGSGVWISYYELEGMLKTNDGFENEFQKVIENCKDFRIENLYLHTRAFGETLYPTEYFPLLESAKKYEFDVFEYIVTESKKNGLKIHAWINPYRISANSDIEKLNKQSIVYKWINDQEMAKNVGFANGIYLNPASTQVRALVLNEVRELITKYNIDGIHFDDYFYPTQKTEFDKSSYKEYKIECENPLSLSDYRRENVNILISSCKALIKHLNNNIVFSISPTASINNNYEKLYADVETWIKQGLVDEIIPQLYFGFEYPDKYFRFENLLKVWKDLLKQNPNVKLKIGLGVYKAKPTLDADKSEWKNNPDIIARQVKICESDSNVSGYVYFSYSSLFGDDTEYKVQREKIKETGESK
ncbi:MAG: family 10 glycosylhydrolase [Clostridia bacterium]|nr:family 10 glycosylhydrolase [Clostridia bacterium]